ncbi:MAG: hypothetical protein HETSPECPRED_000842 [Heterodermia speciosa]|uniref:Uncharacterized protein n=1 Tax=Heterodermia speciosa TaxID=116794 RepID=A0A8H3ERK5_9LECA|nr:MAG: hypothetical protein HETSPECPRED_000842 [Heterodermia speciosa]
MDHRSTKAVPMNSTQSSPRQRVRQIIRALDNLLTTKLQGDHCFSSEQALNVSIKTHIHSLKVDPDLHSVFRRFKQEYSSWFKIHLWLLENMVAEWSDAEQLNFQEGVELVRLRTELEDADGWRQAVRSVRDEDDDTEEEDLSWG